MRKLWRASGLVLALALALVCSAGVFGAEPIAEAYTNYGEITVELMAVERKGNVLTVKWAARNQGDETASAEFGMSGKRISYAVDEENGTKYFVLTDEKKIPIASANDYIDGNTNGINVKIDPGKVTRHWMKLPAPPPEVTSISIFLTETEPFEGVAITDR